MVAFDYSKANNYDNFWLAQGNSNYPTWVNDPNDEDQFYLNSDGQYFENSTNGRNNRYTFTIASELNNNLFLGASFVSYDVDFYQTILIVHRYNSARFDQEYQG